MIPGKPSRTASIVAAARHLAGAGTTRWGEGIDPLAPRLLPPVVAGAVSALRGASQRSGPAAAVTRFASFGLIEHAGLRTLAVDEAARPVVARGVTQKVVLGAGLDARAYRMGELAKVHLFEVDHPSTQAWKQRVAGQVERPGPVTYVPVDFERDSLRDELLRAGFDPAAPTLWVWEGVTPYLPAAARHASLNVVSELSAPGSRLIMSYMTPEVATIPGLLRPVVHAAFHLLGEPLLGAVETGAVERELVDRGWTLAGDEGTREWAARFAAEHPPRVGFHERIAIADRLFS